MLEIPAESEVAAPVETPAALRRIRIVPTFPDDGRRRVGAYRVLLGDLDISRLVRRVEIDMRAGGVATAKLELLPTAVELEVDGLPVLVRGEPTAEEIERGAVDVAALGSKGGWRETAGLGHPRAPGYKLSMHYDRGPVLVVRCPAADLERLPDRMDLAGAALVRCEIIRELWAHLGEAGAYYRLAPALEVA